MNNCLIYKHTSPSGKSYIGQTNNYNNRCRQHKTTIGCPAFHNAIKKHGWDSFTHEILHENLTIDQANELEAKCILEHNTLSPNGYNLKTGGLNSKHSDETKAKMSLAGKGKIITPESKAKMSLAKQNMTPETKAKISLAGKGRILTPESKAKMSLSKKTTTFEKLKQQYLQVTLTEDNYSATKLAEILIAHHSTIIRQFNLTTRNPRGYFTITLQQIHNYFNQPNPYLTLDKSAAMC